jgi:hypothetical protein
VKTVVSVLPKLEAGGRETQSAPERRTRHIAIRELDVEPSNALF